MRRTTVGRAAGACAIAACLVWLGAVGAGAQDATVSTSGDPWTIPDTAAIEALLADRIGPGGVGVVVGILEPAGTRIVTFGRSGAADARPLDGDTVFQIGSLTKVFTSLLLADMVVRGEVGLEDEAARYLPAGVTMPRRGRPITLIDLSKHWSGLPSMPDNFPLDGRPDPYAAYTSDMLYAFLSGYTPPREPGTQAYSNLGVSLLGRLLARRAGMEYEALLKARVLEPLGLDSTSITLSVGQRARLAPGHDRYREPVDTWELVAMPASGSLRSTASDLLTFLAANLDDASPLAAAMTLMRTPGRALGWGRSRLGGEDVYAHEGGKAGYRSAIVLNPVRRTGVVVLTNSRIAHSPLALARHILYRDAPLPPLSPVPVRPASVVLDRAALDACTGTFVLDDGGRMRVARRDDHLLVDRVGDGIATFFASAPDRFSDNTDDRELVCVRDGEGRVSRVELRTGEERQAGVRERE